MIDGWSVQSYRDKVGGGKVARLKEGGNDSKALSCPALTWSFPSTLSWRRRLGSTRVKELCMTARFDAVF
ncbi:hypothetical protein E2C01_076675 [Portunus trituberculatus]|uniref:Uncharacterized protein n=1 Tax=Portunus trituberculatus TaxID=210409 RepID=A0A5B7IDT4_PORTR|nr:hypothetical protein [Portunus trituberculatus]